MLERYFADLQKLFLKRFMHFCRTNTNGEGEQRKLYEILDEICLIKQMILDNKGNGKKSENC